MSGAIYDSDILGHSIGVDAIPVRELVRFLPRLNFDLP